MYIGNPEYIVRTLESIYEMLCEFQNRYGEEVYGLVEIW
jgi:hypothetical protein